MRKPKFSKGNFKKGPKLTWFDAEQVRYARLGMGAERKDIAGAFNISLSHVSNIVCKNRWKAPTVVGDKRRK